jgi:hypothetical protein
MLQEGVVLKKPPTIKEELSGEACPECGANRIFMVEIVFMKHPAQSMTGEGIPLKGAYVGCPACTYKSKMIMVQAPDEMPIVQP